MKIVINDRLGGFSLSDVAFERLLAQGHPVAVKERQDREKYRDEHPDDWKKSGKRLMDDAHCRDIERNDPALIALVEDLGARANGRNASLAIVEIPDDVKWQIEGYDGAEWVAEKHRRWGPEEVVPD